jgi:hypothetical protein
MAGRAKAGCGANLVQDSYSLNGSEFISFRFQAASVSHSGFMDKDAHGRRAAVDALPSLPEADSQALQRLGRLFLPRLRRQSDLCQPSAERAGSASLPGV